MKPHRQVRICKTKPRKFNGYCDECGKSICSCKAYSYVDESNAAISNSSPVLCKECYEKKYNVHIDTEVERFKKNLINSLHNVQENAKMETIRIDKLITFIENAE
jgi:hypothetical protein